METTLVIYGDDIGDNMEVVYAKCGEGRPIPVGIISRDDDDGKLVFRVAPILLPAENAEQVVADVVASLLDKLADHECALRTPRGDFGLGRRRPRQ